MIQNLFRVIYDSEFRFAVLSKYHLLGWMSDEKYLKKRWKLFCNSDLNLDNPKTYAEKLQWLKLYDRNPVYSTMVDKYEVRRWVSERIGEEYVIPVLGVWNQFDEIDFEKLPNQFVLKCTHDSGSYYICKDKSTFDLKKAKKKLSKALRLNYYNRSREFPYKNVKPRIIAEPYLEDENYGELRDYKFFTFGGEPKILYITQGDRTKGETTADFFDMDFNHLDLKIDHEMGAIPPQKPVNFELMKELAQVLSQGTPQVRVDFYEVNGKVYFGELTFFHCAGYFEFTPEYWGEKWGDWVELPEIK